MITLRLQFAIFAGMIVTGIALPLLGLRSGQGCEQQISAKLELQAKRIAELSKENQRLSNLNGQAAPPSLSEQEKRALLKLRGEMGPLREAAAEVGRLRAQNQMNSSGNTPAPTAPRASRPAPDATILAYWPKDQLAFAGYADPKTGLETFLWAVSHNDLSQLLASASLDPEMKAEIVKLIGTPEGVELGRKMTESFAPYSGFYVVSQKMSSPDLAILDVFFEGEGATRKVAMTRTGQEWKFKTMLRAGQADDNLDRGIWP